MVIKEIATLTNVHSPIAQRISLTVWKLEVDFVLLLRKPEVYCVLRRVAAVVLIDQFHVLHLFLVLTYFRLSCEKHFPQLLPAFLG